jgi:N-acetylglucosamine malate deacetylase 1
MNILAVGAHPDDLEMNCGGTLAKYAAQGHQVFMAHVSTGNVGHVEIPPEDLIVIRGREAKEAGALIHAEVISLGEMDLCVRADNLRTRDKVVDLIRYAKPDLIITHNPKDYMDDHEQTSELVFSASMAATVPHHKTGNPYYPRLTPIYYMEPVSGIGSLPEEYVDISEFIEIKLDMLKKHVSQHQWLRDHDGMDVVDLCRTMARFRGYQCGVAYAEGFTSRREYHKLATRRLLP